MTIVVVIVWGESEIKLPFLFTLPNRSGKSSMMIALFRIQEACEGQIFVDGIDTATVPLHVLRSKLGTMSSCSGKC